MKTPLIVICSMVALAAVFSACATPEPIAPAEPVEQAEPLAPAEPIAQAKPAPLVVDSPWDVTVEELGLSEGDQFALVLPAAGEAGSIWGTWVYTSDSSVGTAAVHSGLIDFDSGGTVEAEVTAGQPYYIGSFNHDVPSSHFGSWPLSFTFVENGKRVFPRPYVTVAWDMDAEIFPEDVSIALELPPDGLQLSVWGTDVYTSDSSIGTAAVHAGLITFESGGRVTIRRIPGLERYVGSEKNGVTTSDFGYWGRAFEFVR